MLSQTLINHSTGYYLSYINGIVPLLWLIRNPSSAGQALKARLRRQIQDSINLTAPLVLQDRVSIERKQTDIKTVHNTQHFISQSTKMYRKYIKVQ